MVCASPRRSALSATAKRRPSVAAVRIIAACLASRTGNPLLGGGVWGGEVFLENESTAGEPAPSKPVQRIRSRLRGTSLRPPGHADTATRP
jgi:hypothetical protein